MCQALGCTGRMRLPGMLTAAHPCLQEKLLATGLFSSRLVGGHAEHNTANSTKAKRALLGSGIPKLGSADILRKGRAQRLPATAGMKAEFKIVAEMLKFLSDKEGTR